MNTTVFHKTVTYTASFNQILRSFHVHKNLSGRLSHEKNYANNQASLFYTNLPKKKREKKVKVKKDILPVGHLVIDCKRKEFNHYSGMQYGKFDVVPLASKGWHHKKSVGDKFTILPFGWHTAFVTKEDLPVTFEEVGCSKQIIQQLKKNNIDYPTVIQAKSIQPLVQGENVFILAENGSGKTYAYLMGVIEIILKWKEISEQKYNAPMGIILAPTRELAIQIGLMAKTLGKELNIKCETLIGGHIKNLRENPEIKEMDLLVCTLRVLRKHLSSELISTERCKIVVVDETDSFLESGFLPEFQNFINHSKLKYTGFLYPGVSAESAQICFVSSIKTNTMEETLLKFTQGYPIKTVSTPYVNKIQRHVPHEFFRVNKLDKVEKLLKILKKNQSEKLPTVVFSNKPSTNQWLVKFLQEVKIECISLDSNEYADDRLRNFRDFSENFVSVLCCTDLGSRGLEFPKLKQVINFEFPSFLIDYIHRCGRIGRINQPEGGSITNLVSAAYEIPVVQKIEHAVRLNNPLERIHIERIIRSIN